MHGNMNVKFVSVMDVYVADWVSTENSLLFGVSPRTKSCSDYSFQRTARSATYALYWIFSIGLLHTENFKQLFCTTVYSLKMGHCGPKQVTAGVL